MFPSVVPLFISKLSLDLQVADCIAEQKLDLTEVEFALLLQACARGSASWHCVQELLSRMTKELTGLQPETLAAAEQYFRSDAYSSDLISRMINGLNPC